MKTLIKGKDPLDGMTQAKWDSLPAKVREQIRDNSNLTSQLLQFEGWRVEVVDLYGSKRRFNVGKSTGWRPCHLEIKTARSFGGTPADKQYQSVKGIRRIR